jgi:tRNA U54 and U55 pseudouridine synthase Pus10
MHEILLGKYLTLQEFCTCTQMYQKYADPINPYPENLEETIPALQALCQHILDPVIDHFGRERFQVDLRVLLKGFEAVFEPERPRDRHKEDPSRDQHMAHEKNRNGKYYCNPLRVTQSDRLGAACVFGLWGWRATPCG